MPRLRVVRKHRGRFFTLGVVVYVAAAAVTEPVGLWGFALLAFAAAAAFWAGTAPTRMTGGASLFAAIAAASAAGGAAAPLSVHIGGNLAAALALVLAHLSLARLSGPPSLAGLLSRPTPVTAALSAAAFVVPWFMQDARAAAATGLVAAAIVTLLFALFERVRRRYELGLRAPLALGATTMLAGLILCAAASRVAAGGFTDVVTRAALAPTALVAVLMSERARELAVLHASRVLAVLIAFGGVVVLVVLDVSLRGRIDGAVVAAIGSTLCLALGALAPRVADGLRPAKGVWLDAFARAEASLLETSADLGLREALSTLRRPLGQGAPSPELWLFDTGAGGEARVLGIDTAGYAHDLVGVYPADVVAVAASEPCATVRTAVLEQLEVRRPDLRPALRWLLERRSLSATLIMDAGEMVGLLVVPSGMRDGLSDVETLEEITAQKRLADRLASVLASRAAIARGLSREQELRAKLEAKDEEVLALDAERSRDRARHERAAARLARPAQSGLYAPSSRLAYEALEARARLGAPTVVFHASGVDPVPFVARAHLAGARRRGALVVVDGTSAREHDLARWVDPLASPLALADKGLLLLVDGALLPADVQRVVAQAVAEKRGPWESGEPLDTVLAVTSVLPMDALKERLEGGLMARLADALLHPIHLPTLAERAEDLRALLADRLAREGLRARGEPLALSDGALHRIVERVGDGIVGDEAELQAIVLRLVAVARGPIVSAEDIEACGLPAPIDAAERRLRLV